MRRCFSLLFLSLGLYCIGGGVAVAAASSSLGVRVLTRAAPKNLGPRISSSVVRRAARAAPRGARPLHLRASGRGWYRHHHRHPHRSFREVFSDVVTNHDPNEICRKDDSSLIEPDANDRPSVSTLLLQGMTEIAVEAASGFVVGYMLGCVTDMRLWKNVLLPQRFLQSQTRNPAVTGVIQRTIQTHSKCLQNAKNWGSMAAVFGTFQVATKMARNNVDDEWNYIIGSAAAGAFFSRQESVKAMVRSAVSYGGLVYFLSGAIPWLATEHHFPGNESANPIVPFL